MQRRKEGIAPPSQVALAAVRDLALLLPFPTVTKERKLHGAPLPVVAKLVFPASATDDTVPPPNPTRLRDLAAVSLARKRTFVAPGVLRDPRRETRRHRNLLAALGPPVGARERQSAFDFPSIDPDDDDTRVLAGSTRRPAKSVGHRDRRNIHGKVAQALTAIKLRSPAVDTSTMRFTARVAADRERTADADAAGDARDAPWKPAPHLLRSTSEVLEAGAGALRTADYFPPQTRQDAPSYANSGSAHSAAVSFAPTAKATDLLSRTDPGAAGGQLRFETPEDRHRRPKVGAHR